MKKQGLLPLEHSNYLPVSNTWEQKARVREKHSVWNPLNNTTKQNINSQFYEQPLTITSMEVVKEDMLTAGITNIVEEGDVGTQPSNMDKIFTIIIITTINNNNYKETQTRVSNTKGIRIYIPPNTAITYEA
jgi:hypothetical protein